MQVFGILYAWALKVGLKEAEHLLSHLIAHVNCYYLVVLIQPLDGLIENMQIV